MTGNPSANASYHVLLVEEDPKQAELYSALVREVAPCTIDLVSSIDHSFEWVMRASYHLVIVGLSGAHGLTLLEQIKSASPMTSVIVLAEHGSVEQAVAAIRMGAEDYLKKPFNLEAFQLAIKRGLDRKAVFGENAGASSFLNLLNSCQMISASLSQKRIFGIVQGYLQRELSCSYSAVYRRPAPEKGDQGGRADEKLERLERVDELDREARQDRTLQEILDITLHSSNFLGQLEQSGQSYRFVERSPLTPGLFLFRFRCADPGEYFLVCLSPTEPASLGPFESRLRMFKAQIEVTGKNIDQYRGVQTLAYVDDATGLYNMRYLNHILDREIGQAQAGNRSFAVLFIDADRFKQVNDGHGHLVGTALLNELGALLKKFVRESDTVFRYGGDEFVAVLAPCDLPTARAVAERIRHSVEQHIFLTAEGLGLHFTVSIGVALFPDHARSKKAIIDTADQAMYQAKRKTKNCVAIAAAPATGGALAAPERRALAGPVGGSGGRAEAAAIAEVVEVAEAVEAARDRAEKERNGTDG